MGDYAGYRGDSASCRHHQRPAPAHPVQARVYRRPVRLSTSVPRIESLLAGLSAEQAGLKPGDIILAVNSAPVTTRDQVVEILREFREGQSVKLHLQREADSSMPTGIDGCLIRPTGVGFSPQRRSSRITGEVSERAEGLNRPSNTTPGPAWLCGGPLANLDGKAIGLNIARAGRVTTYALPARLVQRLFKNLKELHPAINHESARARAGEPGHERSAAQPPARPAFPFAFQSASLLIRSHPLSEQALLGSVNWAIYTVLGHRTIRRLGPLRATAAMMLFGTLMLAPLFLGNHGWLRLSRLSPVGSGALLFLGIGCSGLGYLFWYGALERIEVSRVAAFLYLEPFVTLLAAVGLLHEPVNLVTIAGGLTVLLSVFILHRAP